MNRDRELWRRGRKIAEGIVAALHEDKSFEVLFLSLLFNEADYLRAHEVPDFPPEDFEAFADYQAKMKGLLSYVTDDDRVRFIDMLKALDALGPGGIAKIKARFHAGQFTSPALTAMLGKMYPEFVLKPSEVKL